MKKQKKKFNHYRKKRIPITITIDYRKVYKISFAFKSKTKKKYFSDCLQYFYSSFKSRFTNFNFLTNTTRSKKK